jgi:HlyD family secretion protein
VPPPSTEDVKKAIGVVAHSPVRHFTLLALAVLFVLAASMLAGAWYARAAYRGPVYETAEAKRGDVSVTVGATGTLQPLTTVEVGAEVTGRVLRVLVDANDIVKTRQILAQIDPEELHAAADQAAAQVAVTEAAIHQARATVAETSLSLERSRRLQEKGFASREDVDTAIAANSRACANLASTSASATLAKAALKSAESRVEKATIRSPIDGIVLSRLVEPGQTVTAGFQTPLLFKLAQDLTRMRLNVDIDEADVGRVRDGLQAVFTVEAYPGRKFPGHILSLHNEPKTSQNVITYQAVLSVDNSGQLLRPGMTCAVTIISETKHDVLLVPNAALRFTPPSMKANPNDKKAGVEGRRSQQVWVLNDHTPVAVEVQAGVSDGTITEIIGDDLKPGTPMLIDVKEAD